MAGSEKLNKQEIQMISIERLQSNDMNPRTAIDERGLEELAESISRVGVLSPILVRPKGDDYEIVAGERRYRACKIAGIEEIPSIVKDLSDDEVLEIMLIENAQREDLNDVEKGKSCIQLKELYPDKYPDDGALAKKIGVTRSSVRKWVSVATDVPEEIQDMIATQEKRGDPIPQGSITSQVALQITRSVKDQKKQLEVAKEFAEKAIPVHKARKVMKEIKEAEDRPVKKVVTEFLSRPPDLPFRLKHCKDIVEGRKTQTSRSFRPEEEKNLVPGVVVTANIWQPKFAELEVTKVEKKRLGDFTEEDAKREGGYSLDEFKSVWEQIHGKNSWRESRKVTVVHFRLKSTNEKFSKILK